MELLWESLFLAFSDFQRLPTFLGSWSLLPSKANIVAASSDLSLILISFSFVMNLLTLTLLPPIYKDPGDSIWIIPKLPLLRFLNYIDKVPLAM